MIFDWLVAAVSLTTVLWTLLPIVRHDAWWVRVFDFPRVQVAILNGLVFVIYLAFVGWRDTVDAVVLIALLACTVFQAAWIAPYTRLYSTQLKGAANPCEDDSLSLLVANVLTPNRNAEALLRMIREHDPDVVLALETDSWWESQLDVLESDYPYTVKHPLDNLYGMHLYSRLQLVEPHLLFLVEDDIPSIHTDIVMRSGHKVELHCLHPAPPTPNENLSSAERDAELLVVAKTLDAGTRSVVVMGDLNDVAWSATTRLFQKVSGLLDPRVGRGMFATFHAKHPLLRWPLDHVFCSSDFTLVSLVRLPYFGSDHFPIHAVLCHTPRAEDLHDEPEADADDLRWAEEKIEKVETAEDDLERRVG